MNTDAPRTLTQRFLDVVEVAGNKVPHPALIFLTLIAIVVVLSHLLYLAGASVSHEVIVAETRGIETGTATYDTETTVTHGVLDEEQATVETRTVQVRSLLTADGVRFMYVSLVPNLMSFSAMGLMIAAMVGVGVAELSGLVTALIRKLAIGSPRWALTYILVLVGIVSSVASNAGYLVLVPLAGTAFLSVGRHPLAGLALGFAAVGGTFAVNLFIKPIDAVLVTFTNEAIHLVNPGLSIGLASNLWFSIVSVLLLTVLVARISERTIEPRLGTYEHEQPAQVGEGLSADESRGLRYASWAMLGVLVVFGLLALPPGAPLRDPHTGDLIGNTPFMDGLIAVIMLLFLAGGLPTASAPER